MYDGLNAIPSAETVSERVAKVDHWKGFEEKKTIGVLNFVSNNPARPSQTDAGGATTFGLTSVAAARLMRYANKETFLFAQPQFECRAVRIPLQTVIQELIS